MSLSALELSQANVDAILREFRKFDGRWNQRVLFSDFCESASSAIANAYMPRDAAWEAREASYMRLVEKHGRAGMEQFCRILALLVAAQENWLEKHGSHTDVLGRVWENLEMGNDRLGQFYTPMEVCQLMAAMQMADASSLLEQQPYITVCEPCVGAGRMVIAAGNELRRLGHNPAQRMVAHCVDLDLLSVQMSHITLTLCDIPAVLVHGDSLSLKFHGSLHTLAYARGEWAKAAPAGPSADAILGRIRELLGAMPAEPPTDPDPQPAAPAVAPVADRKGQLFLF